MGELGAMGGGKPLKEISADGTDEEGGGEDEGSVDSEYQEAAGKREGTGFGATAANKSNEKRRSQRFSLDKHALAKIFEAIASQTYNEKKFMSGLVSWEPNPMDN